MGDNRDPHTKGDNRGRLQEQERTQYGTLEEAVSRCINNGEIWTAVKAEKCLSLVLG